MAAHWDGRGGPRVPPRGRGLRRRPARANVVRSDRRGRPGRIAPTDRGDDGRRPTRRCPCLRHRAGIRAPAEHRHRQEPRRRPADGGAFRGGPDRRRAATSWPRSIRGRSRCSSTQAEGQLARDQALLENAQRRPRALPRRCSRRTRSRSSSSTRRRRWSASTRARSRPTRARSTARSCSSPTAASPRRSAGGVGLRLVDPGNIVHAADANGLVVITQLQPIAVRLHDPRGQPAARCSPSARRGERSAGRGLRPRADSSKLADGHAADRRQPDRPDDRHGQAEGACSRTTDGALFPNQFVNVRLLVDVKRDATVVPGGRDPARRAGHVRLRRQGGPDGRQCARSTIGVDARATTPSIDSGLSPRRAGRGRRRRQAARRAATVEVATSRGGSGQADGPKRTRHEPVPPLHPAAGRDHAADGRASCSPASSPTASCRSRRCRRSTTDHPGRCTFYPGASPDVMASSVTAPLERQFGQMPGLKQMTSTSSGGSSVITLQFSLDLEPRRRRAGGAGGDQRGRHLPAARPAEPADLQQGQSGRRADPHAGAHLGDAAAAAGRGPRRHAARAEDLAAARASAS